MIQRYHKVEAPAGSFPVFDIGRSEVVLTSVSLFPVNPGEQIMLRMEIGWERPVQWDTGELEVAVRHGSKVGPVVYWTTENCFQEAKTSDSFTVKASGFAEHFYLTVRSAEGRARIKGPFQLEGKVGIAGRSTKEQP
ncbi:hypothetical protein [Paenibacillus tarimensis]|uniref:hypothetical protein n=1 Tax=Paenibacillus tarimensis TaxID=416012 RepID=UPI001F240277|nr:hypothetical protein [Paenibacillus tarimensis]MCF2942249.1 hypothetical protein [Paenibacillus tarimensis]